MKINEEVVTTTDNAGAGMDTPKLPIKQNTILKRYKELKRRKSEKIK